MKKVLKILLSFSKAERIGLAALLVLLVFFILVPYIIPSPKSNDADVAAFKHLIDSLSQHIPAAGEPDNDDFADYRKSYKSTNGAKAKTYELFTFDPNTANAATFERLGFSPKQAAAIVNYRSRGVVFRAPADFKKVFVVSPEMFERLEPYLKIDATALPQKEGAVKYDTSRFQKAVPQKVELNTADTSELRAVRGIGAYTAKQIVSYREQLGGFASIEQLRELKGMTDERLGQIAPQLSLNKSLLVSVDLKTADEAALKKHPYIGAYAARGVVHFRQVSGANSCTIDELVKNNILSKEQGEKLRPYCSSPIQ